MKEALFSLMMGASLALSACAPSPTPTATPETPSPTQALPTLTAVPPTRTRASGSVFVLGSCCGSETELPQTRFGFSVRQMEDGTFKVLQLPPYAP